jgi:elongation factor Ts
MAVTASMVKELRERTGAGMMECKKALVETNGDVDAAIEFLRKSGLAQADKKASRIAADGRIAVAKKDDNSEVVMVEINCETDFVAKDASFLAFTDAVAANALIATSDDIEPLMATEFDGNSLEVSRQALITKIGENIQVRRMARLTGCDNVGAYVHGGHIGVLVDLEGGNEEVARDITFLLMFLKKRSSSWSHRPPTVASLLISLRKWFQVVCASICLPSRCWVRIL